MRILTVSYHPAIQNDTSAHPPVSNHVSTDSVEAHSKDAYEVCSREATQSWWGQLNSTPIRPHPTERSARLEAILQANGKNHFVD